MEIKKRCSQVINKKRCKGVYRPALMRDDWKECPDCGRTGRAASGECGRCEGAGWLFVNSHPKPKQKDQTVQPGLFQNLKTGLKADHRKG
jgi:DnaJ-class molecular chaperone